VHDRAERGRVDEVDGGEVEDDAGSAPAVAIDSTVARRGAPREVELAGGDHEQRALDRVELDGVARRPQAGSLPCLSSPISGRLLMPSLVRHLP
jgi:hypothetical protein